MTDKYKDAFAFAVKIGPANIFWHFARVVQICDTIEEAEQYLKTHLKKGEHGYIDVVQRV